MKKVIIIILVGIIFGGIIAGILYWQNQKYQTKMIKLDACLKSCSEPIVIKIIKNCRYECLEKYGITIEEFGKWKSK